MKKMVERAGPTTAAAIPASPAGSENQARRTARPSAAPAAGSPDARAICARWRMPPDKFVGIMAEEFVQARPPAASRCAFGFVVARAATPRLRGPKVTFSSTVIHGNSDGLWNTTLRSGPAPASGAPSIRMRPVGRRVEAGQQIQQRALAAATGSDQANDLAFLDGQPHFVQRPHLDTSAIGVQAWKRHRPKSWPSRRYPLPCQCST